MGGKTSYPSARQTILALVNGSPVVAPGAKDPHLTFDRYFRIGRHASRSNLAYVGNDVLVMFRPEISISGTPGRPTVSTGTHISVSTARPVFGIDLEARSHEVRKLFYAGFGRRVARLGYDPEEVLQEVYKGLLVRNGGKCPFDPAKSSFGHYVHMVCSGRVANYHRKHARRRRYEVFGVRVVGDTGEIVDVAEADLASVDATQFEDTADAIAVLDLTAHIRNRAAGTRIDPDFAAHCAICLIDGMRRGEIAASTGKTPGQVGRVLRLVRESTLEWHAARQ
jgi:DNA-directed RNA polymerase specialized sigma24 family protein